MMLISSLIRHGKRHLHTIISTQIIKPSFPTPSRLKTYNLSTADQFVPSSFMPLVTFYPKIDTDQSLSEHMINLKNSLSRTLTKYYPFAGRHTRIAPTYVDCNDQGAEFVEASVDSTLSQFLQNSRHEDLDQFFPYGRVWRYSIAKSQDYQNDTVIPLVVKVNRFECGGVAVAVSLSHKLADACSLIHFVSDWAKLNRVWLQNKNCEDGHGPSKPHFISYEHTNYNLPEFSLEVSEDCVTRTFVFPDSKLNALKSKVTDMTAGSDQPITNPTRVEVLIWLLYKCAVAAATKTNSGFFTPSSIFVPTNIRDKVVDPLPDKCIGNLVIGMQGRTTSEKELKPELLISELRKQKRQIQGLKNLEAFFSFFSDILSNYNSEHSATTTENAYTCNILCGYPAYAIDFGWGDPIKATIVGNLRKNSFVLMDGPNKESVEALVCLEKHDMDVVQRDPELLAFC